MELTPQFVRQADGTWQCICHSTETGAGATPEDAYAAWMAAFQYHIDPNEVSG